MIISFKIYCARGFQGYKHFQFFPQLIIKCTFGYNYFAKRQ